MELKYNLQEVFKSLILCTHFSSCRGLISTKSPFGRLMPYEMGTVGNMGSRDGGIRVESFEQGGYKE